MKNVPVFNVDFDKACPKCGKPGSVNGGMCMKCLAKWMKSEEGKIALREKFNDIANGRE